VAHVKPKTKQEQAPAPSPRAAARKAAQDDRELANRTRRAHGEPVPWQQARAARTARREQARKEQAQAKRQGTQEAGNP
jgi:hypothetical protein